MDGGDVLVVSTINIVSIATMVYYLKGKVERIEKDHDNERREIKEYIDTRINDLKNYFDTRINDIKELLTNRIKNIEKKIYSG